MRIIIVFLSIFLFVNNISNAQYTNETESTPVEKPTEKAIAPRTFLGFSTGINNMVGILGPQMEYSVSENFSICGGLGLASWGNKVSAAVKYYKEFPHGFSYSIGYSATTGLDNFVTELEVSYMDYSYDSYGNLRLQEVVGMQEVALDLHSASTVNLVVSYFWKIGRSSRFHIDLGNSFKTQEKAYRLKTENVALTQLSKNVLSMIQPGGIVLGAGFTFAL